ncbi:MAG: TonB-dependent receptor [Treponema sp.]|jgi:vitamin B12 transporter|nr:TonB-dependent receptor [Treponema sp.]
MLMYKESIAIDGALSLLLIFTATVCAQSFFTPQLGAQELQDEGVTVETAPVPEPSVERIVSKETIEKSVSRDLAELLQDALNLGTLSYGGYGNTASINLRGFDAQRIAFLIDGVLANSPVTGGFDFAAVAPESIESITVVEGGSDSTFNTSGALGGVVNIVTAKKQAPGLRLSGSLSNTSYLPVRFMDEDGESAPRQWADLADAQRIALSLGYGVGEHSFSGSLFANRAGNHFPFRDGNNIVRRKSGSEVWDTGITASYTRDLPYSAALTLKTNAYFAHKNIPRSGYSPDFDGQQSFSLRESLLLNAPRAFSDFWATELLMDYSFLNSVFDGDGQSLHRIQAINRWAWFAAERFVLKTGADYAFAELVNGTQTRFAIDGGVYLTAYIQPHQKFLFAPSVKAVFREESAVLVPKLGLLWRITDQLSLKNNYYRSFKHPDMEDLYWDDGVMTGNPKLKSEDGWGADAALSFQRALFTVDGSLFAQWTRDSIHWYPLGATWKPQNEGEAAFWGCKVEASAVLPIPPALKAVFTAKLSLSYQLLESRLLTHNALWEDVRRIPYTPTHTAGFALEGGWGAGFIIVSGLFESTRFADTANARELAPFFLLNLNVRQKLGALTLFGMVRNLLNVSYQTFADYPLPGLSATFGVQIQRE